METKTQTKQLENKTNKKQRKNTWKHINKNTTKDQTTNCDCDEGGGMAEGVDSPGEKVVGGGYCLECGGHTSVHGAHVPARAVQAADCEVSMESWEACGNGGVVRVSPSQPEVSRLEI